MFGSVSILLCSLSLVLAEEEVPLTSVDFQNGTVNTPVSYDGDEIGQFNLDISESGTLDVYNYDVKSNVAGLLVLVGLELRVTPSTVILNSGRLEFNYNSTLALFEGYGFDGESMVGTAELMQITSNVVKEDGTNDLRLCRVPLNFLPPDNPEKLVMNLPGFGIYLVGIRTISEDRFKTYPTCIVTAETTSDGGSVSTTYEALAVQLQQSYFFSKDRFELAKVDAPAGSSITVRSFNSFPDGVTPPDNHIEGIQILEIELTPPSSSISATLKAMYDVEAVRAKGFSEKNLRWIFWDEDQQSWMDLSSKATVDKERMLVSQETTHFSTWTITSDPDEQDKSKGGSGIIIAVAVAAFLVAGGIAFFLISKRKGQSPSNPQGEGQGEGQAQQEMTDMDFASST